MVISSSTTAAVIMGGMATTGFATKVAIVSFTIAVAIEAGNNITFTKIKLPLEDPS